MRVTVNLPMPQLAAVEAAEDLSIRITWKAGLRAHRSETVDLSPLVKTLKFYKPLRSSEDLFRTVHLILNGSAIAWGDEKIDMAATSVERLAEESMTAEQFRAFLTANDLTHAQAAAELGYGRRRIEDFLSGKPIPRVFVLACYGYVARKQTAGLSILLYDGTQISGSRAITSTIEPGPIRIVEAA